MFVIESIRVARSSESICVYMVTFIVEFDHSSRATRYSTSIPRDATRFGSGNQFSLEKFPHTGE